MSGYLCAMTRGENNIIAKLQTLSLEFNFMLEGLFLMVVSFCAVNFLSKN
jgi:hypothetical protein